MLDNARGCLHSKEACFSPLECLDAESGLNSWNMTLERGLLQCSKGVSSAEGRMARARGLKLVGLC